MIFHLENIYCLIVAGPYGQDRKIDYPPESVPYDAIKILTGDLGSKLLTKFPAEHLPKRPMLAVHDGTILFCGFDPVKGEACQTVFQFDHGIWKEHSVLNRKRFGDTVVSTPTATFIFGRGTYEYLPVGTTTWLDGGDMKAFLGGCGVAAKSGEEIWLIDDCYNKAILFCFDVKDHTLRRINSKFRNVPSGKGRLRCALIPGTNKIAVTDGLLGLLDTIDTEDGSIGSYCPEFSGLDCGRRNHGMGIVTVNGENRLAVFGRIYRHDRNPDNESVELYNPKVKWEWETTNIKLGLPDCHDNFTSLSVRLGDIISKL